MAKSISSSDFNFRRLSPSEVKAFEQSQILPEEKSILQQVRSFFSGIINFISGMISSLFFKSSSFFTQFSPCKTYQSPIISDKYGEAQEDCQDQPLHSSLSNANVSGAPIVTHIPIGHGHTF